MKIEEFIRINRNAGETIKTICGYYFQPHFWKCYSFPLHFKIPVNENLVKSLRWKYLITTIFTDAIKKNTYEFILNTNNYEINNFPPKRRNDIRQSLKYYTFKRPSLEDMLHFGLEINRQALIKQLRKDKKISNIKLWAKYITSIYSHDNIIVHGAYLEDRLVGYLIVFEIEQKYNIHFAFIDRQASGNSSPMKGMIYTLVNKLIEENGTVTVSYGVYSIIPKPELYRYKCEMLFKKMPASRVYVINPLLLMFFGIIIFFTIKLLKRKTIRNNMTRTIIRLYQGNRLLTKERKKK